MNKFEIVEHALYEKAFKKLSKRYKNIENDIGDFLKNVKSSKDLGVVLKSNVYKVRIANSNKNRGKSAGYRVLTYLALIDNKLHMLYIYDKSDMGNLTEKQVDEMITKALD
jgi:mRNA-degrading endonuclease RelE of RelBE toxin-antitoxin system